MYNENYNNAVTAQYANTLVTTSYVDRLKSQKQYHENALVQIDKTLVLLEKNPELTEVLDLIRKIGI